MNGFQLYLKYVEKKKLYFITTSKNEKSKMTRIIEERSKARFIVLFLLVMKISTPQHIGKTKFTKIDSHFCNPVFGKKDLFETRFINPLKIKASNRHPKESTITNFPKYD